MMRVLLAALVIATGCAEAEKKADDLAKEEAEDKTKEDEKEEGRGPVSLSHESGTYSYYPWVRISVEGDGINIVKTKAPGASEFESNSCTLAPYTYLDVAGDCAEITESGTLYYKVQPTYETTVEGEANYQIELNQLDASLTSKTSDADTGTQLTLTEEMTYCEYDTDGNLGVTVAYLQAAKLTADYKAYLHFEINDPEVGTVTINQDNSQNTVDIEVAPKSDRRPSVFGIISNYTTRQAAGLGGSRPASECRITLETVDRGKVNKGSIDCTGLRNYSDSVAASEIKLGKVLELSTDWQCERYD